MSIQSKIEYRALVRELESLLQETYLLWDPGWVTFNWRRYTYDHVQRVRALALTLGEAEGADPTVLGLAALLHDITKPYDGEYITDEDGQRVVDADGYWQNEVRRPARANEVTGLYDRLDLYGQLHNESGATIAAHLLRWRGVDQATIDQVAETIRQHLRPADDVSVEGRCLYDADTIDANIGLPAFVRNIYINLHFHDRRKDPETPPIAERLREDPQDYLESYIRDNLPRWGAGKRRDFVPRLLTDTARDVADARLVRLQGVFAALGDELDRFTEARHHGRLAVALHYMYHRDDPSIAEETDDLAAWCLATARAPAARALIHDIQREIAGEL